MELSPTLTFKPLESASAICEQMLWNSSVLEVVERAYIINNL